MSSASHDELFLRHHLLAQVAKLAHRKLSDAAVEISPDLDPNAAEFLCDYLARAGVKVSHVPPSAERREHGTHSFALCVHAPKSAEVAELAEKLGSSESAALFAGARTA